MKLLKVFLLLTLLSLVLNGKHNLKSKEGEDKKPEEGKDKKPEEGKEEGKDKKDKKDGAKFFDANAPKCSKKTVKSGKGNGVGWKGPHSKFNPYDQKKYGLTDDAFFFDYIQGDFREEMVQEMEKILKEVKGVKPPSEQEFADPFALKKMLNDTVTSAEKGSNKLEGKGDDAMLKMMKSINPSFNPEVWKQSVSTPYIFSACKDFKWNCEVAGSGKDMVKNIVNSFDFDGDGRLNTRELILMVIRMHREDYGNDKIKCKNCFKDIVKKKIVPIFKFLDCNEDDQVGAENLWLTFEKFKRKNKEQYNMYSQECVIPQGSYRTAATNDVVLKNWGKLDGFITKSEFIQGVLLGFWSRQTSTLKVVKDDSLNLIKNRWEQNGKIDIECKKIAEFRKAKDKANSNSPFLPNSGGGSKGESSDEDKDKDKDKDKEKKDKKDKKDKKEKQDDEGNLDKKDTDEKPADEPAN